LCELLHSYIRQFNNLKSLTITEYPYYSRYSDAFLTEVLSLPTLSAFSVTSCDQEIFRRMKISALHNLTALTVRTEWKFSVDDFRDVLEMPYIKCLSININDIEVLGKLFEIMINVEQLNLSISTYHGVNYENTQLMKIPTTLTKLQIEIESIGNEIRLEKFKQFLHVFKNQVCSLMLIVHAASEEFSNFEKFQSLTCHFTQLQTFHYEICTEHQPDTNSTGYSFFTLPKPFQFNTEAPRDVSFQLEQSSTPEQLLHCNTISVIISRTIFRRFSCCI
jgi:hypothetical protein